MTMRIGSSACALAIVILSLTSCGGGDSGSSPSATAGGNPSAAQTPTPTPTPTSGSITTQGVTSSVGNVFKTTSGGLPYGMRNAAERRAFPHYIGTLKDLTGRHPKQLPMRSYFASCNVDGSEPRMFVSMTLEDPSGSVDPDIPTIGSVFETVYDPATRSMRRTGNETTVPICHETHGIAVSKDCSRVAVLCNTAFEKPVSESGGYTRDLVAEKGTSSISQPNNIAAVDANNPGATQEERSAKYRYNGEMWLLEWNQNSLTSDPAKYVIHKAVGGQQLGANTLVYSEDQDTYGAAFTSNTFDGGGGRHKSGALMVIDRANWQLNPPDPNNNNRDRGWTWNCAGGHVLHMRTFFNPFTGHFGALCTTDGSRYWYGARAGAIGAKMETSSTTFSGYESFLVAAHNSAVTAGGGHKLIPIDEDQSIIALVGTDIVPTDDPDYMAFIKDAEEAAIAQSRTERGMDACSWYWGDNCTQMFLEEWFYNSGDSRYPTFRGGFWNGQVQPRELSKIGILKVDSEGRSVVDGEEQYVKWVAEDDDCMLGAPQIVDLQNGRFLLGYAKFQCISDDTGLKRFAGAHTLHPKAYYLMEIDADGNALTEPTRVEGTGWGGQDDMVSFGPGRAAWAYIPNPEIRAHGSFTDPYQSDWELMVYDSSP